ncbi:MAG: hypothetical protein Q9195_002744 [Heterodermia aff. obscurata]
MASTINSLSILSCLLSLFSLPTSSVALPSNPQTASDPSQLNVRSLSSPFDCTPNPPYRWTAFPHAQNCAAALRALPSSPNIASFHTGGPGDGYQLPTFERYKDCEALIELRGGAVRSSWLEIGLAALEVNAACLTTEAGTAGAVTFTGVGDRIKITLRGTVRNGAVGGNSSMVAVGSE